MERWDITERNDDMINSTYDYKTYSVKWDSKEILIIKEIDGRWKLSFIGQLDKFKDVDYIKDIVLDFVNKINPQSFYFSKGKQVYSLLFGVLVSTDFGYDYEWNPESDIQTFKKI